MKQEIKIIDNHTDALAEVERTLNWWMRVHEPAVKKQHLHAITTAAVAFLNVFKPIVEVSLEEVPSLAYGTQYREPERIAKTKGRPVRRYYYSEQAREHLKIFCALADELGLKIFIEATGQRYLLLSRSWATHVTAELNSRSATIVMMTCAVDHKNLIRLYLRAEDSTVTKEASDEPNESEGDF
jgi:phenylpyruvate tautomerase PptA (4-oxalocrotonate tautomerase family)